MSDDPTHQGYIYLQGKGIFNRWKKHYCAVFIRNHHGIERLEIYANETDFNLAKNAKNILLGRCISIRIVSTEGSNVSYAVQLVTGDLQLSLGTQTLDEAKTLQDALCRSAFPNQYERVAETKNGDLSPPAKASSPDEPTYDAPWDLQQFRVLLIPNDTSKRLGIQEGPYDLTLGTEAIILKLDERLIEAWAYAVITWFGYGENSCAFEAEGSQVLEFKCAKPANVYERLRNFVRLKQDNGGRPNFLKQAYFGSYVPHSALNSPNRTNPNADLTLVEPRPIYSVRRESQDQRSLISAREFKLEHDESFRSSQSAKRRFTGFFRRKSKKANNFFDHHNWKEPSEPFDDEMSRDDIEPVDTDWTLYQRPRAFVPRFTTAPTLRQHRQPDYGMVYVHSNHPPPMAPLAEDENYRPPPIPPRGPQHMTEFLQQLQERINQSAVTANRPITNEEPQAVVQFRRSQSTGAGPRLRDSIVSEPPQDYRVSQQGVFNFPELKLRPVPPPRMTKDPTFRHSGIYESPMKSPNEGVMTDV